MKKIILYLFLTSLTLMAFAERTETELKDWMFAKSRYSDIKPVDSWQKVTIPHDWAITTPFERKNDLQSVQVVQNGETQASEKTGRSGGLNWFGVGWYQTTIHVDKINLDNRKEGRQYTLLIDGAMSDAHVFVNGVLVLYWPYGYNSFSVDLTPYLKNGDNELSIRLENRPQSSRWYPGAGLFRNVHLIATDPIHVDVWGTYVTTPSVNDSTAIVDVKTLIKNAEGKEIIIKSDVLPLEGRGVIYSQQDTFTNLSATAAAHQTIVVHDSKRWSPERPYRYRLRTFVYCDGREVDSYSTPFGIRTIDYSPEYGFRLNGQVRKFKGVCLHHDLGPLGAAVNTDALRHQLTILKDMGCDAIRTSHNMPAPELVELCDEMGLMMMIESFDVWDLAKCENDYHKVFHEIEMHRNLSNARAQIDSPNPNQYTWAERDIVNMIHHYRNNPCVMMWSVGNEVWNQTKADGWKLARQLQDICHREDPTRPVTCGMDQVLSIVDNGFGAVFDVPGLNYRTMRYQEAYQKLPQKMILGSETASTVSSRGVYKFPVTIAPDRMYDDNQSSGYDVEYCAWSGLPDQDFALQDDYPWTIGQFVWTGFDYLGEPSPYDTDAWPSHSSYFGIVDLASLPKDRYYLYRSQWNKDAVTLHALPHWTWPGREGQVTPVFVYTTYPQAEVLINGISQGRRVFATKEGTDTCRTAEVGTFDIPVWGSKPEPQLLPRYRLMWLDTEYQPGEMKVYAYANEGDSLPADSIIYRTADKPKELRMSLANAQELKMPGAGHLHYFTISAVDHKGNPCPTAANEVSFRIEGHARFVGCANGDPACLYPMQEPRMPLFSGQCTLLVEIDGPCYIAVKSKGLKKVVYGTKQRHY